MAIIGEKKFSKKGFIFSTDFIIAFIIILFIITSFIIIVTNNTRISINFEEQIYLEGKTVFVADSFVKNYNENNTMLGACVVDFERKRVLSNEISSENFSKIRQLEIDDFFVKKISTVKNGVEQIIFFEQKNSEKCITAKRFALVDGMKKIVLLKGCLNE